MKACSRCGILYYCSLSCRIWDWKKYHKYGECGTFQQAIQIRSESFFHNDAAMFLLRLYLLVKVDPGIVDQEVDLPGGKRRSFSQMEDRSESMFHAEWSIKMMIETMRDLKPLIPDMDLPLIRKLHAAAQYYSLKVLSPGMQHIGSAVYVETSILHHSCRPNATTVWQGNTIDVRTVKRIDPGDKITVSLVDLRMRTEERRKFLCDRYFMYCTCDRCSKSDDPPMHEVDALHDKLRSSANNVAGRKVVNQMGIMFQNFHSCFLCQQKVYGKYHPVLTVHMVIFARQLMQYDYRSGNRGKQVTDFFRSLNQAIRVTHGDQHPLFQEFLPIFQLLK